MLYSKQGECQTLCKQPIVLHQKLVSVLIFLSKSIEDLSKKLMKVISNCARLFCSILFLKLASDLVSKIDLLDQNNAIVRSDKKWVPMLSFSCTYTLSG